VKVQTADKNDSDLVAKCFGDWIYDQQVASLNPSRHAVECNPGQVVYTRASVIKQYNLVPASGQ